MPLCVYFIRGPYFAHLAVVMVDPTTSVAFRPTARRLEGLAKYFLTFYLQKIIAF